MSPALGLSRTGTRVSKTVSNYHHTISAFLSFVLVLCVILSVYLASNKAELLNGESVPLPSCPGGGTLSCLTEPPASLDQSHYLGHGE